MPQTVDELQYFPEFSMYVLLNFDESIVLGASFADVFKIDARQIGDGIIVFDNPSGGSEIEYRIYGSAKFDGTKAPATPPVFADPSWINILRDPLNVDDFDPANYDHNFARKIPAGKKNYESFTNKWSFVLVRARVPSGSATIAIWERAAAGGI